MKKIWHLVLANVLIIFSAQLLYAHPAFRNSVLAQTRQPIKFREMGKRIDTATFATGCFWCTEAKFMQLQGVVKVVSGFTGGSVPNPTYKQVCTGTTGHAEACNIIFDPAQISYDELLAAFFKSHDPSQLNRQGNDVGTQYRSGIYYHNKTQKEKAGYYINALNKEQAYKNKIVTEVKPFKIFYPAGADMQDYSTGILKSNIAGT